MHVVFITQIVPSLGIGGDGIYLWTAARYFLETGHRVTFCIQPAGYYSTGPEEKRAQTNQFSALGAGLVWLPEQPSSTPPNGYLGILRRTVFPDPVELNPNVSVAPQVVKALREISPSVVVPHHFPALATTKGLDGIPRLATLADPDILWDFVQWRLSPIRPSRRYILATLKLLSRERRRKAMVQVASECERLACHSAHHAAWYRRAGLPRCVHLPVPTIDPVGQDWWHLRKASTPAAKPKIIMVGRLTGSATIIGLYYFANQVLPLLERQLGSSGFEVHIIGRSALPADLARKLARPAIKLSRAQEDYESPLLLPSAAIRRA